VKRDDQPTNRDKLVRAASELLRRKGFVATTVDDICEQAGVTKGAFFHHFAGKEAMAKECLRQWDAMAEGLEAGAAFQRITDPLAKAVGYMEFLIRFFSNPKIFKSCLAGTTLQEVSQTHPELREAAHACFANAEGRFRVLLESAAASVGAKVDSAGLAQLWMATLQGSLLLSKGSRDESVIPRSLEHVKAYIARSLEPAR